MANVFERLEKPLNGKKWVLLQKLYTLDLQMLQKSQRSNSWSDSFLADSNNPSPIYVDTSSSQNVAVVTRQASPMKRHFEELAIETKERDENLLDPRFQNVYESLKGTKGFPCALEN